ncbi:type II toxin-antitoxin system antitoxin SocA domain-containing protein [Thermodesulfovibrio thiophilus]|uniref:type II toxin-antitoxin system antitoxin SocA domain-containing protein n=1 Tax=Thermodesulfovibrio thiophilus TaxID=340095 RepID=UPI000409D830|nr:type II toxin-antitoxin system antitoxin SocA domain-containing protein [Thermodesulfovibrio thiophilus]
MTINRLIGEKIKKLRTMVGYTQLELAKKMGVSRPTISQMENGEKKFTAEELISLSRIFNISVEQLLGLKEMPEVIVVEEKDSEAQKHDFRISVPQKNIEKIKEVLLYILNKVGSKPNIGEGVLYKIFYFIDFDFYEKYEEQLIGATYIKNHYGPTPVEFTKVVESMIHNNEIVKIENKYFNYPQTKYLPLRKPDLTKLKAHELEVIEDVINRLADMNAAQISNYSHKDVPWIVTDDGEKIEYETVFYRTPEYSVREYSEDDD